jgi:antitoxin component YwqK of YwqJK toxin-antitoxin module
MRSLGFILIIFFLAMAGSCSPDKQKDTTPPKDPNIRVVKEYYPDGRLKATTEALGKLRHGESKDYRKDGTLENLITYENNRKHGPARNYYSDGETVKTEIGYVNGYKHGEARWYYPNGSIYRITPYASGKINGIRKSYYENGNIQAEVTFLNGQPGVGLKEYNPNGSPKNFDAHIVFSEQDRISLDNTFRLTISLSDGIRSVKFYQGHLTDEKFWNDELSPINTENGRGLIEYHVSKGTFKMETLNIVGRVKTSLNNYHYIQREYHLALENRF